MVGRNRRTFLTNTLLTSSVLAAARKVEAQNTNALAFHLQDLSGERRTYLSL